MIDPRIFSAYVNAMHGVDPPIVRRRVNNKCPVCRAKKNLDPDCFYCKKDNKEKNK